MVVNAYFIDKEIETESSSEAKELYEKSGFGTPDKNGHLALSLSEALYLFEKNKIKILNSKNKEITSHEFAKKAKKIDKNFSAKYRVFSDLRSRGYVVKTALKFGADFRVYDRGIKPGQDHAKWIVFCVNENEHLTWSNFAAKNRVAHSTKKKLLLGIIDEENDITYYEVKWVRP